jgi:Cu/Ag efflux pump CusA
MAISRGAGAASRHDMGTGVIGGMISATLLAVFFVPVFYVLVRRIFKGNAAPPPAPLAGADDKNNNAAKP